MVSKLRHRLVDESIRSGTLIGSWLRSGIPEIVQEEQLLEAIRDKSKRSNKGKGKAQEVASVAASTAASAAESSDVELVE